MMEKNSKKKKMFFEKEVFLEDENNSKDDLCQFMAEHLNFNAISLVEKESKFLQNFFIEYLSQFRAVNLMNLRLMEDFDFFDSLTLEDMLSSISKKPQKILTHFNPQTSQAMNFLISYVHQNPKKFADLLHNFFTHDPTMFVIFAYSTFPALYGYFSTVQYCGLAFKLLECLIEKDDISLLSSNMIASFFFTQHRYFEHIYSTLFDLWLNAKTVEDLYLILVSSFNNSFFLLTYYHVQLIRDFYQKSPNAATQLVMNGIVLNSLVMWGSNERCKIPKQIHKSLVEFIREKSENPENIECQCIVSQFLNGDLHTSPLIPNIPPFNIMMRVPLVFSDRDIVALVDIVGDELQNIVDSHELIKSARKSMPNGYSPFFVEVISPNDYHNSPKHKKDQSTTFSRAYSQLEITAKDMKANVLEFIPNSYCFQKDFYYCKMLPEMYYSQEFHDFALSKYIQTQKMNYDNLNNFISLKYFENSLDDNKTFCKKGERLIAKRYAERFITRVIKEHFKSKITIDNFKDAYILCFKEMNIPKIISEQGVFAIFDQIVFVNNAQTTRLRIEYANLINSPQSIEFLNRIKTQNPQWKQFIEKRSNLLQAALVDGYGTILNAIIELSDTLNYIILNENASWTDLFPCILIDTKNTKIIDAFYIYHKLISGTPYVTESWSLATNKNFYAAYSVFAKMTETNEFIRSFFIHE